MRYRDIRRSISEMGGSGMAQRRKDDGWKNSVMNPDNYTPSKARELGLINDKEYVKRQTQAQGIEPVYPELFLTPAGAARGISGAAAKNVVGRDVVPSAGTAVKNVVSKDVVPAGGNVVKTPKLNTIDTPPQLPGPRVAQTKQIGRNDPNVIDVTAKDITNRQALSAPASAELRSPGLRPPSASYKDNIVPGAAAVAGHAALGGALYAANQAGKKDNFPSPAPAPAPAPTPTPAPAPTPTPAPAPAPAPVAPPKTDYKGSAAAQKLAAANNIANPNFIKVGQTINLGGDNNYTVKQGDTLDKIAARSSSSVAPQNAVVPPAPATATTFSQDVADRKATNAAPITPAKPAFTLPEPDELIDLKSLLPKSSPVAPAPAAAPPAPATLDQKLPGIADTQADAVKDFTRSTTDRIKKLAGSPEIEPTIVNPPETSPEPVVAPAAAPTKDIERIEINPNTYKVEPLDLTKESRKISRFPFLSGL